MSKDTTTPTGREATGAEEEEVAAPLPARDMSIFASFILMSVEYLIEQRAQFTIQDTDMKEIRIQCISNEKKEGVVLNLHASLPAKNID